MEKENKLDAIICEPLDRRGFVQAEAKHSKRGRLAGRLALAASALWTVWKMHHSACKTVHVCFSQSFIYLTEAHELMKVPIPHTDKIEWSSCGDGYECGRLLYAIQF